MIVELVEFQHPQGTTREQALEGALQVVAKWQANPQLQSKHFLLGEDGSGAGVYIWPDRAAAQAAHSPEWIAAKEAETGGKVRIRYFDLLVALDNQAGTVRPYDGNGQLLEPGRVSGT